MTLVFTLQQMRLELSQSTILAIKRAQENDSEHEHALVITYCMFFSISTLLFHDAFTLEPLLCESHLFVADLKIHTSISRHWASFSITTVWLQ